MVSMEVWVAAAEACRQQLKQQRSQLEHLQGGAHELSNRAAALAAEVGTPPEYCDAECATDHSFFCLTVLQLILPVV